MPLKFHHKRPTFSQGSTLESCQYQRSKLDSSCQLEPCWACSGHISVWYICASALFAGVRNGVIFFKCYLVSFYRQEIGLYLPLMAPQGRFLFICAEVSTYRKEKKVQNGGMKRSSMKGRNKLSMVVQFLAIDSFYWYNTMIDWTSTPPISSLSLIPPVAFHIFLRFTTISFFGPLFWHFCNLFPFIPLETAVFPDSSQINLLLYFILPTNRKQWLEVK